MVRIEKEYVFGGPRGAVAGRTVRRLRQLIFQHISFGLASDVQTVLDLVA
jgi:hypothetical protein